MYQFKGSNALLENFYKMIMLFREYHIVPIFVFDGTPPEEKKSEILNKRDETKKNQHKSDAIFCKKKLEHNTYEDDSERKELEQQLQDEQKKSALELQMQIFVMLKH